MVHGKHPPSSSRTSLLSGRPAWFLLLLLIAASSFAAAAASSGPGLIHVSVGERLGFGTPVAGRQTVVALIGSDSFVVQILAYVNEPVNFTIPVHNQGSLGAIAVLACTPQEGVVFAASTSGRVVETGDGEYSAFIPPGETQPFNLWFMGTATGQFHIRCSLRDAVNATA